MRIAVMGEDSANFCDEARRLLALEYVELCRASDGADALLLLDREWSGSTEAPVAIVRGDAQGRVDASVAISYGMSPRDTLTVSGVTLDGLALSVQREFFTLDGRRVVIQELTLDWSLQPDRALPIAALGLIVGELGESVYAASSE